MAKFPFTARTAALMGALGAVMATVEVPMTSAIALTPQETATARDEKMDEIGRAMKVLVSSAKAGVVDDSTIAAAEQLDALAKMVPSWFPKGTGPNDPGVTKTRALAEIWTKPDQFAARAKALQDASAALVPAAKTKAPETYLNAFKAVGAACKGCHDDFKKPKEG